MYRDGLGVSRDYKKFIYWEEKAASQGNATALNHLGVAYMKGIGVNKNPVKAVMYFRSAAKKGDRYGQNNLGVSYRDGVGVEKDFVSSYIWLKRSANKGHEQAAKNLKILVGWMSDSQVAEAQQWIQDNALAKQFSVVGKAATEGTIPVRDLQFRFNRDNVNGNGIAVVIGNKSYSINNNDVSDVDYAYHDHDEIVNYVVNGLGFEEENVISIKDASQADMNRVFGVEGDHKGELYNWVRDGKSDVFVYYSGHGIPDIETRKSYLMPIDSTPDSVTMSGYPLELLYTNLGKIKSNSMVLVLDACFSGQSHTSGLFKNASGLVVKAKDPRTLLGNAVLVTASKGSEIASWDDDSRLGLLTRYFLEGISGDADEIGDSDNVVTLGELKNYLEDEVVYQARRNYNRRQHPQISGDVNHVLYKIGEPIE